jgi:phosphoribosyl 1,2-cyclic phosphate phosphodiesterase
MKDFNIVTILGSGTSTGVPILGCKCNICQSEMPKNKRFRTSILITTKSGKNILVDTSPDLRSQALRENLTAVDSCIITHSHADHCHGIDDLRSFTVFQDRSMNIYCSQYTSEQLETKFDYIFKGNVKNEGPVPLLDLVIAPNMTETIIEGQEFTFFNLPHGKTHSTCFYSEGLAYLTDCSSVPEKVINLLKEKEVELLILDCNNKDKPHKTHLHLELSLDYAKQINAKRTGLIHMSHVFEHHSFEQELKNQGLSTIFPVYDGQKLEY